MQTIDRLVWGHAAIVVEAGRMGPDGSRIAQMEASVMDYWGAYGLADGGRHVRLPRALFVQSAVPHSMFNSVILAGHDPAAVEVAINLAAECKKLIGVPMLWRIGPTAQGAALSAQLEQAGLVATDPFPAMLMDLSDLPPPPAIDDFSIAEAQGPEERRLWGQRAISAFEMAPSLAAPMGNCEATIPVGLHPDQPRFTGYLNGEPVAVSSLVMTGDLAGIYAVATLPQARKRGIGRAMTLHAMREGLRRGAKMATLQATSMGRPVYESIGFRTVFDYQAFVQV